LMGAQSFAEGARATALRASLWQAEAEAVGEAPRRQVARDLMEILTPVMKAYFTDQGFAAANACLQVLGGHGYIREYGLEQMVRNARIGQIYEGANGIQAIDLVQRKLSAYSWRPARTLIVEIGACVAANEDSPTMQRLVRPLAAAAARLGKAFELLQQRATETPERNLAVAYDVLQAVGIVAVGWTWCEVAAVLQRDDTIGARLKRRKQALATYWVERELPLVTALCERIAAVDPAVLALADDDF
jgi:hypothetical protein